MDSKDAGGLHQSPSDHPFTITASNGFASWLFDRASSLAFAAPPTTLFLVGLRPDGEIAVFERRFDKTMGVAMEGTDRLWLGTRTHLWRLDSFPVAEEDADEGFDRRFVPQRAYTTGYLNTHDVSVDPNGDIVFVATRFSCLARPSETASFEPVWQPPWLSRFGPGDRCHLNGYAANGSDSYVTSVSATDGLESWRDHRSGGGVITHVGSGEIVATGFSMPHSPRVHRGELWCCNSGSGHLCRIDPESGEVERVAYIPGFIRGLSFIGDYAIVGSSRPREGDIYSGLELDETLAMSGITPRLGIFVVDLRSGSATEWLTIEGPMRELYDVTVIPRARRPMAIGLMAPEIRRKMWFDSRELERNAFGSWKPVQT